MRLHYRLYGLNPISGRIVQGRDIVAEDDAGAIAAGGAIHPDAPFEIWCHARLVFSSTEKTATARSSRRS